MSLLFPNSFLHWIWTYQPQKLAKMLAAKPWSGIGLLALAPIMALAAKGAFQRRHWGWFLAISIFAMNGAIDLSRIVTGAPLQGAIGVLAATLVMYWLTRPKVKTLFLN